MLVHESDAGKGGLQLEASKAESPAEMREHIFMHGVSGGAAPEPRQVVAWHRVKDFQLLSLRLICSRILHTTPYYLNVAASNDYNSSSASSARGSRRKLLSPLYLPYISPISPLYLPYISPISPQAQAVPGALAGDHRQDHRHGALPYRRARPDVRAGRGHLPQPLLRASRAGNPNPNANPYANPNLNPIPNLHPNRILNPIHNPSPSPNLSCEHLAHAERIYYG